MSAYGWFAFGMVSGMVLVTIFITTLEATDRQFDWVERMIHWIEDRL